MWTVVAQSEELVALLNETTLEPISEEQDLLEDKINRHTRIAEYLRTVLEKVDTQFVTGFA